MVSRGSGRILFSSSIASTMPAPVEAVYGASKAFVQSFSQALRNELKDTGVSVTALMPRPTETNFFHRAGLDDTKVGARSGVLAQACGAAAGDSRRSTTRYTRSTARVSANVHTTSSMTSAQYCGQSADFPQRASKEKPKTRKNSSIS
jgi:short-subunit dehydrogenase